jgi:hypothetical protein
MMSTANKTSYKSPAVFYSRSKDLSSFHLSKLQDITRYNSWNYNVCLYKSSPNRGHTPIKAPGKPQTVNPNYSPRELQHEQMLLKMTKSFENLPFENRKKILNQGAKMQLRKDASLPMMKAHRVNKIPFVPNDAHVRETNPGFARNAFGGFFTH